jgi:hypothetical protein
MENRLLALATKGLTKLAYQPAEKNKLLHIFNTEDKSACLD